MKCIITAFPSRNTLQIVKDILLGAGISVNVECQSGAEAMRAAAGYDGGILICSSRLVDILVVDLCNMIPEGFDILVLISEGQGGIEFPDNVFSLGAPINKQHLITSVSMLIKISKRLGKRQKDDTDDTDLDKEIISKAKEILMSKYYFTEKQAHRFIQKRSMDNGTKMVTTARLILEQ
ncbi:MAG: response regulator receiver and domain protein [Clostridiales bacterium]|jgi:response regulator NasT|nr:response regulator receiver and domain protein [Clostridiales bacterium]